jgi:hypothetical protein
LPLASAPDVIADGLLWDGWMIIKADRHVCVGAICGGGA